MAQYALDSEGLAPVTTTVGDWDQQTFDITGDWYWELDASGRFTESSRDSLAIADCECRSILGSSIREIFGTCYADTKVAELESIVARRLPFKNLAMNATLELGNCLSVALSGKPVFDASQRFLGYRGVGRDVTEEAFKNEAFRILNEDLVGLSGSELFDGALAGLSSLFGADHAFIGILSDAQPDRVETLATHRKGAKGNNFSYALPGSPCSDVFAVCTPVVYQPEVALLFPDDKPLQELGIEAYVGSPLLDADGSPLGILVLLRETVFPNPDVVATILRTFSFRISAELERSRAANEQVRLQQLLDSFFQTVPVAAYLKTLDGRYEIVNEEFVRLSGIPREEIIGRTVWDLGDPANARATEEHDQEVIATGKTSKRDTVFGLPGRTPITLTCTKAPVKDSEGHLIGLGGFDLDVTEKRRSEELLRAVFANVPLLLSLKDPDGRYLLVNPQHARQVGIPEDEIQGKRVRDVHPDKIATVSEEMEQFARVEKSVITREVDNFDDSGNLAYSWNITKFPVFDQRGAVRSVGCATLDVTQRRRAELAQERHAAHLQAIFDASPAGIFMKDRDGRFITVNDTFAARFGVIPELMIGRRFCDFVPHDVAEGAMAEDQKLIEQKSVLRTERAYMTASQQEISVSTAKAPIFGKQGEPLGICGISLDITDLKRYEQQLAQHKDSLEQTVAARTREIEEIKSRIERKAQDLRVLLDSSSVGIAIVCNETGKRIYVNDELVRMFGARDADQLLRSRIQDTWVDPEELAAFRTARERDGHHSAETHRRRLDGREAWFILSSQVCSFEGRACRVVWHLDITERKRIEADLRTAKEVSEARAQLLLRTQQELLNKERLATLGQLTGTVSHELRNPLATIRNSIASMRRRVGDTDSPLQAPLERADRNIDRCVGIIEQLLSYAKAHDLDCARVDFSKWVQELASEYEAPSHVLLVVDSDIEGFVRMDAEKLRQAFVNLLDNAVHAMAGRPEQDGPGQITIKARRVDDRVDIRIADQGTGISPDGLEQLFEPLYSTKNFGFGLGLPLVRRILVQHDGGIEVESTSSTGTVFHLWFPANT